MGSSCDNPQRSVRTPSPQQRIECIPRVQDAVTVTVAKHCEHIESNLKTTVRVLRQKCSGCPNKALLLRSRYQPVPPHLHGFTARLDFHNDEPRSIPSHQVHLQMTPAPIARENFPTQTHRMMHRHLLTPTSNALSV